MLRGRDAIFVALAVVRPYCSPAPPSPWPFTCSELKATLTTFTVVGESLPPKVATALSVAQIALFAYCVERYGHEFREALENAFGSPGEFL